MFLLKPRSPALTAASPRISVARSLGKHCWFVLGTMAVTFYFWGLEHNGAQHLRDKLAKAGERVKTTENFITGIASKSFLSGKPYLVKFADGHTQPTGECLRAHLAEVQENKR
jgi:Family of unknown function (DUF5329)